MALSIESIEALYDERAHELLAFLAARTHDPEVAVDLVAEAFAVVFTKRRRFRGNDAQAAAWLFSIARNLLADFYRRGHAEKRAVARLGVTVRPLTDSEYDRIEELSQSAAMRARLSRSLGDLPADQRDALRLRVIEERDYPEVAEALGITEPTARARVSRGLRALRDTLLTPAEETPDHA
ncbi:MAG: hypothetical protein QOF76_5468 [Solirubrobacteraceae bacterium]|jgi:RNA polymerase sigma factor (sigma-70 family)|nr:hypothetical protein [Solirubrobacteraceae bacterium]